MESYWLSYVSYFMFILFHLFNFYIVFYDTTVSQVFSIDGDSDGFGSEL